MKKLILTFFLIILLFGCGDNSAAKQKASAQEAEKTAAAQAFVVDLADNLSIELKKLGSLSSYQGQWVFLNFWGVWCFYCRQEMPSIQKMYDLLKDKGLEVVAVNVQDSEKTARDYIRDNKHTFPVLLDTQFTVTQTYGIRGFPTTFLVDKEGYLIAKLVGSRDYASSDVIKTLTSLLISE